MLTREEARRYEMMRVLVYCWEERGDLERSVDWNERSDEIQRCYPELWAAWMQYKLAKRALDAVVRHISEQLPDED